MDEIHQGEQLVDVVLEGSSGEEDAVVEAEEGDTGLEQLAVPVFQPVGLVDDAVLPGNLLEKLAVGHDHLERRDQHVQLDEVLLPLLAAVLLAVEDLVLLEDLPRVGTSVVHDGVHIRPPFELPDPVLDGRKGDDNQERSMDTVPKRA